MFKSHRLLLENSGYRILLAIRKNFMDSQTRSDTKPQWVSFTVNAS